MNRKHLLFFAVIVFVSSFVACKENPEKSAKESTPETPSIELSQEEIAQYTTTGKSIAKSTFMALSGKLKQALKEGGVEDAAEYCNLVAIPLTDSLAQLHNATIKRTSLKLRNPDNKPTDAELEMLNTYQARFAANTELKPEVHMLDEETVQFYAPIKTQQLCLTCHGIIGEELTQENYQTLKSLYPEDEATGYAENELRGMWSISFEKSQLTTSN
jgi:hypothetical protein